MGYLGQAAVKTSPASSRPSAQLNRPGDSSTSDSSVNPHLRRAQAHEAKETPSARRACSISGHRRRGGANPRGPPGKNKAANTTAAARSTEAEGISARRLEG